MTKQPKIRFKGFTEEWKEKGFSELVTIRRGLTYSPESIVSEDGIVVLRSSNISDGQFRTYKDDVRVRNEVVHIPLVEDGDILITAANGSKDLVGKHAVIHNLQEPSVPGGFMLLASGKETTFVNALMGSSWYSHFIGLSTCGGGGSIGNLNKSDLESQIVYIPNDKAERDIIAKYFDSLDSTITSREAELEKLKNIRSAFLKKLFPQDGQSTPTIRFKEFTDEWKRTKLCDFLIEHPERNFKEEFNREDVLSVSGDLGIGNQIELLGRSYAGQCVNNYHVVRFGNIVYTKSPLKEYPYGIVKVNRGVDGIVSTLYAVYDVKENADGNFVEYYFTDLERINMYLKPIVRIGAKHDMKIGNEEVLQNFVSFPSRLEQEKVGTILTALDKVITARERQLTLLKHTKQALLEQMFVNE